MNIIRREIVGCMQGLQETDDGKLTAIFRFPETFSGFKGHFPEKAVLPGICEIQALTIILQEWNKKKVKLKEIASAKYYTPVFENEEIVFECSVTVPESGIGQARAKVTGSNGKAADIKIKFVFE